MAFHGFCSAAGERSSVLDDHDDWTF